MNDNFKIFLQAIIDDSSLTKVQKDLARKKLEIQADIDFSNFAKSKADIEKQFRALSGIIKDILGDTVSDKQATQWVKQYYKEIESGAKQAVKEQEKLVNAMAKGRESSEQARQAEEKRHQLAQDKAINKALEEEYNLRQRIADKSKEIQLGIDTEKYSTQINSIQQQLSKFGIDSGELFLQASASLKQLEAAYNDMKFSDGDERLEHEKEYQKLLEKTKNLLTQVKGQKSNELISNGDNRRISFVNELNNYLQKNTAMTKQSKQQIIEWINTLNSADDMTRGTFDNLRAQFKGLDAELRAANKLGLSWADKFKQAVEKFGGWAIATGSVMEMWNLFRRMPKEVTEVNSAMTELYKVSDASANEINNYFGDATKSAKEYGAAITDVINATADWSRLGYSLPDSKKLAEIAVLYKNVGDGIDISTASKSLVSTLQGFQLEADDALNIIDQFNEVDVLAS